MAKPEHACEHCGREVAQVARLEAELVEAKGLPTDGEICQSCGSAVAVIWAAKDEDWQGIVGGPGGILCPKCFTDKAARRGEAFAFLAVPFTQGWSADWYEARATNAAKDKGLPQPQSRSQERRYKAQGWLPPKVREQVARQLDLATRHFVDRRFQEAWGCVSAALDALEERR